MDDDVNLGIDRAFVEGLRATTRQAREPFGKTLWLKFIDAARQAQKANPAAAYVDLEGWPTFGDEIRRAEAIAHFEARGVRVERPGAESIQTDGPLAGLSPSGALDGGATMRCWWLDAD